MQITVNNMIEMVKIGVEIVGILVTIWKVRKSTGNKNEPHNNDTTITDSKTPEEN